MLYCGPRFLAYVFIVVLILVFSLCVLVIIHDLSECHIRVFFLMIRRPPRSTLDRSSAASDVYKRQISKYAELIPEGEY